MPSDYASNAATVLSVRGPEFFAEVPRLRDALSESRHTADGVVISQYPRPAERTQHGVALARTVRGAEVPICAAGWTRRHRRRPVGESYTNDDLVRPDHQISSKNARFRECSGTAHRRSF